MGVGKWDADGERRVDVDGCRRVGIHHDDLE